MKVLFLLNALTHYYNPILNKLNNVKNLDLVVITPEINKGNVGKGVHQTDKNTDFKIIYRKEKKRFYGKLFFIEFFKIIEEVNPEIIVIIWPYILELVFNPILLLRLKLRKTKIIYKDIPFQLQKFDDAIRFRKFITYNEKLVVKGSSIQSRINNLFIALLRKLYYSIFDATVNYVEDAFQILPTYGVKKEKIFIIYNSPDTEALFESKKKAKDLGPFFEYNPHRIIHIGRLVKWKRIDLLIEAVSSIKEIINNVELLILGNGPMMNELQKLVEHLQLNNHVKFVGAIYDPILIGRYFLSSSIFVLSGTGGLAINEAMIFGMPIICSVGDGTEKKLVRNGFNGYQFKEGDKRDLEEKILLLFSQTKDIEKFGANSVQIIKDEINEKTVISGYIKAFNYVTGNNFNLNN